MEQSTNRFMSKLGNSIKAMLIDEKKRNPTLLVALIVLVLYAYTDSMRNENHHYLSTLTAIGTIDGTIKDPYDGSTLRKMTPEEIEKSVRGALTADEEVARKRNHHWRLYDWTKHWFRPFG